MCEKLAQSFYAVCPAETQTHDLLVANLMLGRQRHNSNKSRCLFHDLLLSHYVVHKLQFSTFIKSICYKRKKTAVYTLHVTAINHDGYI